MIDFVGGFGGLITKTPIFSKNQPKIRSSDQLMSNIYILDWLTVIKNIRF
ncbi:hypothetical protein AO366_0833 [Moraxella catarrhalis]|nr:hypothetical protein AO366_0844 [Moraxella catarrhalis]OAV34050.1 hypothetical protein AO366_0833 [Moraxella catarrhalis]